MRKINLIVLHCSATRENMAYTPEQLERDHQARGFLSAGYNYYIRRSGEIVSMRPPEQIPAHVKGFNRFSLGICYEGGLDAGGRPKDTRTKEQKESIRVLLLLLLVRHPGCRICGHRDLSPDRNGDGKITPDEWLKECPCFNAEEEYGRL
ncbi:N-acetylmuramoyl-L-alanine amidase [Parabacteroides sp. TM07-1AC]|jgi:N-acetylmuramoyl-L-alanine amidase|uniref:N-acetylmuramoyl-L-alanine amidase n=1 Tax=Parabacteroides sp. TM07-1AC TaxID=2292363 RepID=UPI000F00F801|nr:N-acetylmuramoyl-L-alanine amidase [Parabacteroides sp. TM07-1AC]RHU23250.1 N-acetylmuramoyl-L-alanine amidase [Parabacteroides sp. TM07-1AC]